MHDKAINLPDARLYIGRGRPTDAETLLVRKLLRDPRFRRVYLNPRMNQAVFQRIR